VNDYLHRRRLRDDTFLQAAVLATLSELGGFNTGVTCDEIADTLAVGRGRVIQACDRLVGQGLVSKDRGVVMLTAGARAYLAPDGEARRRDHGGQVPVPEPGRWDDRRPARPARRLVCGDRVHEAAAPPQAAPDRVRRAREAGTDASAQAVSSPLAEAVRQARRQLELSWERDDKTYSYATDPATYLREVLKFYAWSRQRQIAESVRDHKRTAVKSAHGTGKTAIAARVGLHFLATRPRSRVITTAPTWTQVETLLWREIHVAHQAAVGDRRQALRHQA
jgi:hypothetical protein